MENRLGIFICKSFYKEASAVLERDAFPNVELLALPAQCDGFDFNSDAIGERLIQRAAGFSHIAVIGCQAWNRLKSRLDGRIQNLECYLFLNCFEILLNGELLNYFLQQGAYLLTPDRTHHFKDRVVAMGFSESLAREFYGETTKKLTILDPGISDGVKADAEDVSRFLDLPYEILPVGLEHARRFLSNIILRYQVDSEKTFTNDQLARITRQTNDYALVFDQLENLVRLSEEKAIIGQGFLLFNLLFAPSNIVFVSEDRQNEPLYFIPDDRLADDLIGRDVGGDSFCVEISHDKQRYGRFVICNVTFPQYIAHYKDLSMHLNYIIGLAFANARLFMQVSANEVVLQENATRLETLNATKDKLFSIIAHDLINPFNALIGLSWLLIDQFDEMPPDQKMDFLKKINQSANDTLLLLQNLLKWSRTQADNVVFSLGDVDAFECFDEVRHLVAYQAESKQIDVRMHVVPGLTLFGDRDMIQTVLRNLVTNAIKFSIPGGSVVMSGWMADDKVCISVADTGVGIPADVLPSLFGSQGAVITVGTQNEKGSGLGLILCKEFVERHGGTISVDSQPGKGTVFTFRLPRRSL